MKRHIWYHIVLTIFAAWCGTGCSEGYEYFNPNPGDEEQQASPIVNTGKASVDAAAGKATLNGNCNAMGRTVSEAGFLYGRTAAEMMKSAFFTHALRRGQRRPLFPGLHGHRRQNLQRSHRLVRGESGFRSGSDHRTVRSRRRSPHAQRQLQTRPRPERRARVPLRRDRGWRRLRTVRTGYASRRSEQNFQSRHSRYRPTLLLPGRACPPTSTTAK